MPTSLVILGGLGDLTSRYLIPALAELDRAGRLPHGLEVVGVGRRELDTDTYRRQLHREAREVCDDPASLGAVLERVHYAVADATEVSELGSIDLGVEGPVIFYLALPPAVFADAFRAIAGLGLGDRVRVAIEKPFGESLDAARELNRVLDECFSPEQVFRIDHFLGHPLARRLLELRQSPLLAGVWNGDHLGSMDVIWEETVALEGRTGYYDRSGALRDMVQNHLLQLLAVAAMEPGESEDLPAARLALLRHVHAMPERSRHARYLSGTVGGETVPAYVEEEGVDPERGTETFAEIELAITQRPWSGVAIRVRTGKAMGQDNRCVILGFAGTDDHLTFGIAPARLTMGLAGAVVSSELFPGELSAYAAVLADLFEGERQWFVSGEEAEEQWRIVAPVLDAWDRGTPPLAEYPAGSAGPT